MTYNYIYHLFMPGHTISSVVRMHNNMISDPWVLSQLFDEFNSINNNTLPRVGMNLKIPVVIQQD